MRANPIHNAHPTPHRRQSESGVALMLVLSSLILLTLVVASFNAFSDSHLREKSRSTLHFRARLLAESGLAIGLHPEVTPSEPLLRQDFEDDTGFRVRITREAARIPVNSIETDRLRQGIKELFVLWGVADDDASLAVDSLTDWIDIDSDDRNAGAEVEYYEGLGHDDFPTNTGFATVDEIILVRGMDKIDRAKPNWREYFTVHTTGLIDLNSASIDVISAVLDVSVDDAAKILAIRNGSDSLAQTEDDAEFTDLQEVADQLGIKNEEWGEVSSLLTVSDSLRRIESIGRVGGYEMTIVLLAQDGVEGVEGASARFER